METNFNAIGVYEKLLSNFERDRNLAKTLQSPNVEDEYSLRAAIIGFSYNAPTELWGRNHFEYIQKRALDRSLLTEAEFIFACECLGYLLGMYETGKLSDEKFQEAEAQLPGYIMLKSGTIR